MDFFDDTERVCCETIMEKKKLAITDKMVAKNLHHFDVFTIIFRWNNYIPDLVRIFPCTNN